MTTQTEALKHRITDYLSNGGLFNPELANHVAVRDLLIECREALAQPERHELQAKGKHAAPCARFCEANAFQIEIRRLKAQLAQPEQEPVARAWDEGYRQGVNDERTSEANIGIAGFGAKVEPARQNPYGATQPQRKEPEQEPVAWAENDGDGNVLWNRDSCFSDDPEWLDNPMPLYTTPPQRKPLTDEQIAHATAPVFMGGNPSLTGIARAIEAAHGIKE